MLVKPTDPAGPGRPPARRRRRSPRWARFCLGLGLVLVVLSGAGLWGLRALTDRYDRMPAVGQFETVAGHPLPALLLSAFEVSAPIKILLALERLAPAA